ncbi:MAG: DUF1566 domain-containing protein, partial [Desulfobacteraceae bacterium]
WQKKRDNICAAPLSLFDEGPHAGTEITTRQEPVKQRTQDAHEFFSLTPLMTPLIYIQNEFARDTGIIHDRTTGLTWQQSGSLYPMNLPTARTYIDHLNQTAFAGINRWRLPTIDELVTLLRPLPENEDHCIEPVFDTTQTYLWSSDACTFISSWYVNIEMGFVGHNDVGSFYYVRAVS